MKTRWNSLVVGGCNAGGVILLVLSVSVGGSAVRAAGDSAVLDSVTLEPLMKLADVFQQRIAKIEASVMAVTQSLTTKRIAAQELCVVDESGAQTCITKAQLDALLKGARQTAQAVSAPATPAPPQAAPVPASSAAQGACSEKCVAPDANEAAAASETPPAAESPAGKETTATAKETAAAKEPVLPESAGDGAKESAPPEVSSIPVVKETAAEKTAVPEGAAPTVLPAAEPAAAQHQAPAETPAAAEAIVPTLLAKPAEIKAAETVITTAAKPETLELPAKLEDPVQTAPATTGSAATEPTAVPAEAPAVSEHKE